MREAIEKLLNKIIKEVECDFKISSVDSDRCYQICKIWSDFAGTHEKLKIYKSIFSGCKSLNDNSLQVNKDETNIICNENINPPVYIHNVVEIFMNNDNLYEQLLNLYENIL